MRIGYMYMCDVCHFIKRNTVIVDSVAKILIGGKDWLLLLPPLLPQVLLSEQLQ